MTREDIIRMAREAGLPYIYQTGEVANLGLVERFAALVVAAEREQIIAQNAPEIEKINAYIKALETDPAIHFCHRFAILMESMLLSNDSNLNTYWDAAHALLDEYKAARDKWMEAQGQPYVSGFGKD